MSTSQGKSEKVVEKNTWVSVSYTGKLQTGEIFDNSRDGAPLIFQTGANMVVNGFEDNIVGMKVGEKKEFTITAKDAYGEMTEDETEDVPKEAFDDVPDLAVGMLLMVESPGSGMVKGKVLSIQNDTVTISKNHPLAGEDLTFSVKVEKILTKKEGEAFKRKMLRIQQPGDDSCGDCG